MDCPLCGAVLSDARPRYRVTLGVDDETRSAEVANDETATGTQVCADCWSDIKDDLS